MRRDFTLTGGPTFPNSANPQTAEVLYREALLNLNENREKALEQLQLYARTGANMRQVGRALLLISEYGSKPAYGDQK